MQTQLDQLNYLAELGFEVDYWIRECSSIQQVSDICEDPATLSMFNADDIEYDGIVIKINELDVCKLLGTTNHHPRRGMAYKFPAQQAATTILSVDYQVGRTGIITPVANLMPVTLSGASISSVSLHNFDIIKTKDIRLGDRIWLQRSGEVIPYVIGPIIATRTGEESMIQAPTQCPVCDHDTMVEDEENGGYLLYCPNPSCSAQIKERITHFVARDCMDIDGLGESVVDLLVDQGIINTYADLYHLTDVRYRLVLKSLPGFGDKKIDNLIKSLEASKHTKLRRILSAIGVRHIGNKTSKLIIDQIASQTHESDRPTDRVDYLVQYLTDAEFLSRIHGIGDKTVQSCVRFFADEDNIILLHQLHDAGVDFSDYETDKKSGGGPLASVRFAVSGSFEISRHDLTQQLVRLGAEFCPNITKNVTHLIVGQDPSSKVKKAEKNGIILVNGTQGVEQLFGIEIITPIEASLFG